MERMDARARKALSVVRECVEAGRYKLLSHFTKRMDARGLFWPDVLAILDDPSDVRPGGPEKLRRPKWIIAGTASDGLRLEMVCVLDEDERGNITLFITAY